MFSTMHTSCGRTRGVSAEYKPERQFEGCLLPAQVDIDLKTEGGARAWLCLSIEDARTLAAALPQILMLHDAAVRLAAECAVDGTDSAAVDEVGKAA